MVAEHEKRPLSFFIADLSLLTPYIRRDNPISTGIYVRYSHIFIVLFFLFFPIIPSLDITEPGRTHTNILKYLQIFIIIYVIKKINGVFA